MPLPSGLAGNMTTLDVMRRVARESAALPFIQACAKWIMMKYGVDSQDYVNEALAIGDFVKEHVRYSKDPTYIELLISPVTLLEQINRGVAMGDCDDMSLLIASLLLSIGHNPCFRCVRYTGDTGPYSHIYVVDYPEISRTDTKRVVLDAILKWKEIGSEVPHTSGDEYDI